MAFLDTLGGRDTGDGVIRGRPNPRYMTLGQRLRSAREAAEMRTVSLSVRAGLAPDTCMRIEQKGRVPGVDIVERLARVLRISPGWLAYAPLQEITPEAASSSMQEGAPLLCAKMGARLRTLRQERGLSLRALAEVAGLTAGGIGSVETGRTLPSVATAEALARGLGVSPGWLAYGEGPQVLPRAPRRRKGAGEGGTRVMMNVPFDDER